MDDGKIGLYLPGSNLLGQVWEEVRSGGTEMLKESFHVICTTAEKKTRFFENTSFSGNCVAALATLGSAERAPDGKEDLFDQLLAAVKKVTHVQVIITPPPPTMNDAYIHQAKQHLENFPELYSMTDNGGSLLQIGRYGAYADRRYVVGNKWDKEGISRLKAHLIQVLGHHWLRYTPKASATFPLRQLHQQLTIGNAPESQPSTSTRPHDSRLHSTRDGRIARRNAPPRPSQHSNHGLDPRLLNDIISALRPSSSSSKPPRNNPKRK